ncbi:MAG: hypothetical protein WC841_01275 [Candidatus Shapirobacteria bacterium]|jgi:hypothetical protein
MPRGTVEFYGAIDSEAMADKIFARQQVCLGDNTFFWALQVVCDDGGGMLRSMTKSAGGVLRTLAVRNYPDIMRVIGEDKNRIVDRGAEVLLAGADLLGPEDLRLTGNSLVDMGINVRLYVRDDIT